MTGTMDVGVRGATTVDFNNREEILREARHRVVEDDRIRSDGSAAGQITELFAGYPADFVIHEEPNRRVI